MNGYNKPDKFYQRKYLGLIRFQNGIVKVNANYGCFATANSFEKLPDNIRNELRVCQILEPDLKRITSALLASHGLGQGLSNVENLSTMLCDFLNQISLLVIYI
jgi:hypothetical protein